MSWTDCVSWQRIRLKVKEEVTPRKPMAASSATSVPTQDSFRDVCHAHSVRTRLGTSEREGVQEKEGERGTKRKRERERENRVQGERGGEMRRSVTCVD